MTIDDFSSLFLQNQWSVLTRLGKGFKFVQMKTMLLIKADIHVMILWVIFLNLCANNHVAFLKLAYH